MWLFGAPADRWVLGVVGLARKRAAGKRPLEIEHVAVRRAGHVGAGAIDQAWHSARGNRIALTEIRGQDLVAGGPRRDRQRADVADRIGDRRPRESCEHGDGPSLYQHPAVAKGVGRGVHHDGGVARGFVDRDRAGDRPNAAGIGDVDHVVAALTVDRQGTARRRCQDIDRVAAASAVERHAR
jgi:hypothetical protein